MRAIRLDGPRSLNLTELPLPEADGQQVRMKVSACGICGSDLHYWDAGRGMDGKPGLIPGHEFCGTVDDPGARTDLPKGVRITALPLNLCGTCESCRTGADNICLQGMKRPIPGNNSPGAYAEYLLLRPDMVRALPDSVSDGQAVMIEPAAVALHAMRRAGVTTGRRVLVTGGGPIGVLVAAWARIAGASLVVLSEVDPFRKAFAERKGDADAILDGRDPELGRRLKKMSGGGFDAAVETTARDQGYQTALSALKPRGVLVLAGISLAMQQVPTILSVIKEIRTKGSFAYHPEEFDTALAFIACKRLAVESMVTSTIGFDEVQATFERLSSGSSDQMKVMIKP
ncbi:MAG: zinc-dependent alcohol dehydrogenase [Thermodesulfobacteriota bacterium]